ncbi:hypothetical protein [Streptomyces triculaminicus]|uniref:hypothetical protein n=1 Tax=Streptomyces triculaminicus TaxID=2816232 RepID=UPI0037D2D8A9
MRAKVNPTMEAPLRIVREGENADTMTPTDWDRPVSTTPPPANETLETDKLAGLATER